MELFAVIKIGILFLCTGGFFVQASDHPIITLYDLDNFNGEYVVTTQEIYNLESFNNKANSVCGRGLWFLYDEFTFSGSSSFVYTFAYGDLTCENIDFTQTNQVSSLRYAGGFSIKEKSLTMYRGYKFGGNELVTMKDLDNMGDYTKDMRAYAVVGNSSWTIYSEPSFLGDSVCLEPITKNNLIYGLFDNRSLGLGEKTVESVRKGCHSSRKGKQIDILNWKP